MKIPVDGETRKSYCAYCRHETTHVYEVKPGPFGATFRHWKCLGCGKAK